MTPFREIMQYLMNRGYKRNDITDRRNIKHFVAFYYYCIRADRWGRKPLDYPKNKERVS